MSTTTTTPRWTTSTASCPRRRLMTRERRSLPWLRLGAGATRGCGGRGDGPSRRERNLTGHTQTGSNLACLVCQCGSPCHGTAEVSMRWCLVLLVLAGCPRWYVVQTLVPIPGSAPASVYYIMSRRGGLGVGTDRPEVVCRGRQHDDLVASFRRAVAGEHVGDTLELQAWKGNTRLQQDCVVQVNCAWGSPSCVVTVSLSPPSQQSVWEASIPRASLAEYTSWIVSGRRP